MNKEIIYQKVLDFNLKINAIKNEKLTATNFRFAWRASIITEEEYDFYFNQII